MKRFFLRGLAALLPTILTIWIIFLLWGLLLHYVARPVTGAIHWSLSSNRVGKMVLESATDLRIYDPTLASERLRARVATEQELRARLEEIERDQGFFLDLTAVDREALHQELSRRFPPALGFAVGLVGVFFLGLFVGGYLGRLLWGLLERLIFAIPFVKTIYPYAKQIVEFFLGDRSRRKEFHAVVAVPYPHPGIYSLGFVTGEGLKTLNERTEEALICIFMASSPSPITGFTIFIPARKVIPMNLSVDDTFRILISGGVLVPPGERVQEGALAEVAAGKPEPQQNPPLPGP